jgi:hypothetical protein
LSKEKQQAHGQVGGPGAGEVGHQVAAQQGAADGRHLEGAAAVGQGVAQPAGPDQAWQKGRVGRVEKGPGRGIGEQGQVGEAHGLVVEGKPGQAQAGQNLAGQAGQADVAPGEAVGRVPGGQGQEVDRDDLHQADEGNGPGRARALVQLPAQGHAQKAGGRGNQQAAGNVEAERALK